MLDVAATLRPHGLNRVVERAETLELFDLGDVPQAVALTLRALLGPRART